MSRFADIRVEWRVADIERDLQRKADNYEVSTLRSDVVSLERALGEVRSENDGFRSQLQALQDQIERLSQSLTT